jgi:hypothetical protein
LGYGFTLFNELNKAVKNGELFMNGVRYTSDENGQILIPFAEAHDDSCPMILEDLDNPGSSTIHFFDYKAESYRLECGMFVDRESLMNKQQAKIVIRPTLILLDSIPVSVKNLKNCTLTIKNTDAQGLEVTRVLPITLQDDQESVAEFTVPTELRKVDLRLTCSVYSSSQERDLSLMKEENFTINDIDTTGALADMHLIPLGSLGYVLAVLGKNGEPYKEVIVDLELSHRFFNEKMKYTCKTDAEGKIALGRLPDITLLEATARSDVVYQNVDEDTKVSEFRIQLQFVQRCSKCLKVV